VEGLGLRVGSEDEARSRAIREDFRIVWRQGTSPTPELVQDQLWILVPKIDTFRGNSPFGF